MVWIGYSSPWGWSSPWLMVSHGMVCFGPQWSANICKVCWGRVELQSRGHSALKITCVFPPPPKKKQNYEPPTAPHFDKSGNIPVLLTHILTYRVHFGAKEIHRLLKGRIYPLLWRSISAKAISKPNIHLFITFGRSQAKPSSAKALN